MISLVPKVSIGKKLVNRRIGLPREPPPGLWGNETWVSRVSCSRRVNLLANSPSLGCIAAEASGGGIAAEEDMVLLE